MEFNGAVLVDKKKIQSAIENYINLRLGYLEEEKRCQDKLAEGVGTLTWWERFNYTEGNPDWYKVFRNRYEISISREDHKYIGSWLYKFYKVGLLAKETLDKYHLVEEYHNHYTKRNIVATLGVFTLVGNSIYLNEEQARFVAHFCGQGLL